MVEHTEKSVSTLKERLDQHMKKEGLRTTSQRNLVSDIFLQSEGHLSIEDLLAQVREIDPKIGYATIYRTLKLFVESGIAHPHHFGDGVTRYEISPIGSHHDHLICQQCGKIVEFEEPSIESLQERVAKKHGFKLKEHKLELYGTCAECQAK